MVLRTQLPGWQAVEAQAEAMKSMHMKDLFASDAERFNKFSLSLPSMLFDYSKNLVDESTMAALFNLARECELENWREKMFSGERINITEDRSVLHVALRNRSDDALMVDGVNVRAQVKAELNKMRSFTNTVRSGDWKGYTGKSITDVVSIGVGGSNLGPQMTTEALKSYGDGTLKVHYVSNVDGNQIADVLAPLNPETVLFVVSSKTFTTSETMTNANTAVTWFLDAATDKAAIAKHFVAVSTNTEKVTEFGIDAENIFDMWDWVGGRFSLWSAIGLPIALYLGFEQFVELLDGAHLVDNHFEQAPLEENVPVIMALLSLWNCTFLGAQSQAILPYDQPLHRLTAYLQQAEMESNGKHVNMAGEVVPYPTVPTIWGEIGINGQHAFYQYLHQSNNIVPADFIGSVESVANVNGHHDILMANFFAQSEAMMTGVTEDEIRADLASKGHSQAYIDNVAPHKVHEGNRPTNTILMDKLEPKTMGMLIALYEHKIFTQGILLDICSFDQWGVELGKGLANRIHSEIASNQVSPHHDSSTASLVRYYNDKK
ncbi:glucose-6-phosphate isomerase [Thalassotalea sp. PS06]|uniref:glucose-6-phosphate isomerase n=1 Tax=Thalassotalea sp. PS06 TaxID=2594005 RepID=UPI0011635D2A|nr:glucose-6-phosphate isomerase [Thalassotalea sp. PS06]QDP00332.1 glucose-6-phosphate isomerase [Thalassotalea sp. PS06]